MTNGGWSALWKTEDWWAVWLGFILIFLSMGLVFPVLPDDPAAAPSIPAAQWIAHPADWSSNPADSIFKTAAAAEAENAANPSAKPVKPYNVIPGVIALLAGFIVLYGGAHAAIGGSFARFARAFPLVFFLAFLAYIVAGQESVDNLGLSYVLWALVLGLLISNTVRTPEWLRPAVKTELFIKTGLVLLGAEILFGKILLLGAPGLVVAWVVTPIVLVSMFVFGTRYLKIGPSLAMTIAAATSVCGVSAAIATAGACRAKKEELTLAVGMSLLFTVLMMVFMPAFCKWIGMDEIVAGAWLGGTIDATGAVVAAGAFLGQNAEKTAAVVKMIQNILIGVIAFGVAVYWVASIERDKDAVKPDAMEIWRRFPKFIVGFVAASALFSVLYQIMGTEAAGQAIESGVIKLTKTFRGWFFCLAFVCIGLESNFKDLYRQMAGGRPMVLYLAGQSFNIVLTLIVAWLAFRGYALP